MARSTRAQNPGGSESSMSMPLFYEDGCLATAASSACGSIGFVRYSAPPSALPRSRLVSSAVRKITGTSLRPFSELRILSMSKPPMPGMCRSLTTRSGFAFRHAPAACRPFATLRTVYAALRRCRPIHSRMSGSSSTTRMLFAMRAPPLAASLRRFVSHSKSRLAAGLRGPLLIRGVERGLEARLHAAQAVDNLSCPVEILSPPRQIPFRRRALGDVAQIAKLVGELDELRFARDVRRGLHLEALSFLLRQIPVV